MKNKITISILAGCFLFIVNTQKGFAQLKADRLLGGVGLDAGTQAPAGTFTLAVPFYFYNTNSLKNASGNTSIANPNLNMFLTAVGGTYVSNFKILGGTYGASILLPFAENTIQGNYTNTKSAFAYSDTYVQPFQLGWHTKGADFNFNYGLYIPTGKYEFGGSDNSGLGMLANEFEAGTTLRLDPKGSIAFSTLLSYEINNDKKNTNVKTGDNFTAEGGLGKTWYTFNGTKIPSSIIKGGLVYYMQFKASSDQIPLNNFPNTYITPGKDHIYALGLESNILLTKSRMLFGVRWFDEFSAVNRFQGNTFFITVAHVFTTGGKKE